MFRFFLRLLVAFFTFPLRLLGFAGRLVSRRRRGWGLRRLKGALAFAALASVVQAGWQAWQGRSGAGLRRR